jgi:hypothetical protein
MTEEEWLSCPNPATMIEWLRDKASDRKLWLFAAACSRRASPFLPEEIVQAVTNISERLAEGLASPSERQAAREAFGIWKEQYVACEDYDRARYLRDFQEALASLPSRREDELVWLGSARAHWIRALRNWSAWLGWDDLKQKEGRAIAQRAQEEHLRSLCDTLRDLLGPLPFRSILVAPDLLGWNEQLIPKLAQAVYEERDFDRLPILADALEDAGCDHAELLSHLRCPEAHALGCWALDLLVGKS